MKMSEGVEWGLHCVLLLAQCPPDRAVPRHALAEHHGLSESYLAKPLQAMVRAGILYAVSGPRGGFRLARPASEITVLEVVEAIEGLSVPFVCREIRQCGSGAATAEECREACSVHVVMARAHGAWRASLRCVTIGDLLQRVPDSVRQRTAAMFAGA